MCVLPRSRAQCLVWWASVQDGGRSHPGNTHSSSRIARDCRCLRVYSRRSRPTFAADVEGVTAVVEKNRLDRRRTEGALDGLDTHRIELALKVAVAVSVAMSVSVARGITRARIHGVAIALVESCFQHQQMHLGSSSRCGVEPWEEGGTGYESILDLQSYVR